MGDLIQTDGTKWAVWTGGKPNATWTGLDSSAATHDKTPFQRRFAKDASAFEARCAGLPHLFKKGQNLNQFMKDIKETLEIRGMDTITYLVDPADPTVMRNIISEHTRFTAEYVSTVAATQKKKYDSYNVQNDTAAIQMFKASLDSRLVQQVKNRLKPDMCFLEAWMILITVVQTDSVDKYDKLKQDIKSRTPFLYSGQNITTMAQTTRESCDDLVAAGFFEQSLVLTILESFLLADGSEFYKQSLLQLHSKVHSKILDIRYKHHDDQQRAMEADGISYDDICRIADDLYVTDVAKGRWSPAVSNRDSKTPARAFSNLSTVQTLALQQHMTSRQSNRPKNKSNSFQSSSNRSRSSGNQSNHRSNRSQSDNNSRSSNRSSGSTNWRRVPPTDPKESSRAVDELTYYWCGVCRRWTTNHTTEQHCSGMGKNNNNKKPQRPKPQANTFCTDVSAWAARFPLYSPIRSVRAASPPVESDSSSATSSSVPDSFWDNFSNRDSEDDDNVSANALPDQVISDAHVFHGNDPVPEWAMDDDDDFAASASSDDLLSLDADAPKPDDDVNSTDSTMSWTNVEPPMDAKPCTNTTLQAMPAPFPSVARPSVQFADPSSSPDTLTDDDAKLCGEVPPASLKQDCDTSTVHDSTQSPRSPTSVHEPPLSQRDKVLSSEFVYDACTALLENLDLTGDLTDPKTQAPASPDELDVMLSTASEYLLHLHTACAKEPDSALRQDLLDKIPLHQTRLKQIWLDVLDQEMTFGSPYQDRRPLLSTTHDAVWHLANAPLPVFDAASSTPSDAPDSKPPPAEPQPSDHAVELSSSPMPPTKKPRTDPHATYLCFLKHPKLKVTPVDFSDAFTSVPFDHVPVPRTVSFRTRRSPSPRVPSRRPRAVPSKATPQPKPNKKKKKFHRRRFHAQRPRPPPVPRPKPLPPHLRCLQRPYLPPNYVLPHHVSKSTAWSFGKRLKFGLLGCLSVLLSCEALGYPCLSFVARLLWRLGCHLPVLFCWFPLALCVTSLCPKLEARAQSWFYGPPSQDQTLPWTPFWRLIEPTLFPSSSSFASRDGERKQPTGHPPCYGISSIPVDCQDKFVRNPDQPSISITYRSKDEHPTRPYILDHPFRTFTEQYKYRQRKMYEYILKKPERDRYRSPNHPDSLLDTEHLRMACVAAAKVFNELHKLSKWNEARQRKFQPNKTNKKNKWNKNKSKREDENKLNLGSARKSLPSKLMACSAIKHYSAALKMALQAPSKFRGSMTDLTMFPIVWDSGASTAVSFCKKDFVGPIEPLEDEEMQLSGVAQEVKVEGTGHVKWSMMDESGGLRTFVLPALHVPLSTIRLLSTTHLLQTYPGESITQTYSSVRLSGIKDDPKRRSIRVHIDPENNLPQCYGYTDKGIKKATRAMANTVSCVDDANLNLSAPSKEWLKWHYHLGHVSFCKLQMLSRSGVLAATESAKRLHTAICKLVTPPLCAACQYGRQKLRSSPGQKTIKIQDNEGALKRENLFAGQCVSADHFVNSTKGRLLTSKGKTKEDKMYSGGCIFVDHASGYVFVAFQTHLNTHETLKAKDAFEKHCSDVGVVVQQYHTDNGSAFTSAKYTDHLKQFR